MKQKTTQNTHILQPLHKRQGRIIPAFTVFLLSSMLTLGPFAPAVSALSTPQRRIYESGIRYFDLEESQICSPGSGGPANLSVGKDFSLGTDLKERRINLMKALMKDYSLSAEQAAGPVGNFMYESAGTSTVAHGLPPDVNEGETQGAPPKFKGGYGWAQWTGGRQKSFIKFAIDDGYMGSTGDRATDAANYAYLKKELNESYQVTIADLKKQGNPEDAAVSFERTFEKAGKPNLPERKKNARQAFNEYGGGDSPSTGGGAGGGGCPGGSGANAAIVGKYAFPLITPKSGVGNRGLFANNTTSQSNHGYIAYDISTAPGTPVAAFLSGTVTRISQDKCPGRLITIYNKESDLTISYLHLAFNNHVALGSEVAVGQEIGIIGSAAHGCGTAHLHIDAVAGRSRPGCKRESCPAHSQVLFRDIGPQLYETFQALPD